MSGSARTFDPNVHNLHEVGRALKMLRLQVPLASYDWTGEAPGVNDDITKGWKIGSVITVGANVEYRVTHPTAPAHTTFHCSSNDAGNAVWQEFPGTNQTAGSGGVAGGGALDGAVDYVGVHNVATGLNKRVVLNQLVIAGGRTVVDGEGTFADNSVVGQVSLDVKMGFNVPFFSLATPQAIL